MSLDPGTVISQRENLLRAACRSLAKELKLVDPACYDNFLHFGNLQGVYDHVMATLDHHFKNNAMNFSCTGDSSISWSGSSTIFLDLEFSYSGIFAFFRLELGGGDSNVELHHISFEETSDDPKSNTRRLAEAISQVRRFA